MGVEFCVAVIPTHPPHRVLCPLLLTSSASAVLQIAVTHTPAAPPQHNSSTLYNIEKGAPSYFPLPCETRSPKSTFHYTKNTHQHQHLHICYPPPSSHHGGELANKIPRTSHARNVVGVAAAFGGLRKNVVDPFVGAVRPEIGDTVGKERRSKGRVCCSNGAKGPGDGKSPVASILKVAGEIRVAGSIRCDR